MGLDQLDICIWTGNTLSLSQLAMGMWTTLVGTDRLLYRWGCEALDLISISGLFTEMSSPVVKSSRHSYHSV